MAEFITAEKLDEKIAELQKARAQMTRPEHRVCEACFTLTSVNQREARAGRLQCWCDFEGTPDIDGMNQIIVAEVRRQVERSHTYVEMTGVQRGILIGNVASAVRGAVQDRLRKLHERGGTLLSALHEMNGATDFMKGKQ